MRMLNEEFEYNPETGILLNRMAGKEAGSLHSSGYRMVWFCGKKYGAHVLVWAIHTGEWPKNNIDHKDTDKLNNRISNLREATKTQNIWNCPVRKTNRLGVKGVRILKSGNYQARIFINGKVFYKTFSDICLCMDWLAIMRSSLHGEFARN